MYQMITPKYIWRKAGKNCLQEWPVKLHFDPILPKKYWGIDEFLNQKYGAKISSDKNYVTKATPILKIVLRTHLIFLLHFQIKIKCELWLILFCFSRNTLQFNS